MWPPEQIPELRDALGKLGLQLDPASLADATAHPLGAVISLGGCSASFVSPEGLILTNHHCAHSAIQYNSASDRNLLQRGFLAATREAELPAGPGQRALVPVAVDEVTGLILRDLAPDMSGLARYRAIEAREKALVAECERDEGHRCRVAAFHGGLQYRRIKQLELRDVRLVYAPPEAIGKFGGDVDNWTWPRHTGDFALLRAYVAAGGKPAEYHADNVPYRPRHHLRVSAAGLREGDLVILAGYPGSTNRYRLSSELEHEFGWTYPTRKQRTEEWLRILADRTDGRPDAALKVAGLVAGLSNAAKNYQGMLDGFARSRALERKRRIEDQLERWIESDPERGARYGAALIGLRQLVQERQAVRERSLYYESFVGRAVLLETARTLYRLARERTKSDADREPGYQQRDLPRIEARLRRMDRTFDPEVDRASLRKFILDYATIPVDQHVSEFDAWFGITGGAVDPRTLDDRLADMYGRTALGELGTRLDWLDKDAAAFEASEDPFIQLAVRLFPGDLALEDEQEEVAGRFQRLRSEVMTALIAYLREEHRPVYPDANATLRVTYGTVKGYSPRDALIYAPFTSLNELLEKETGTEPFHSPDALLGAIHDRRFGRWADAALGSVPVNFLSTVDTTGGNSGSPTLNRRGELVGLLFDGNYESILSDWHFLPEVTRGIHVDIRYALWILSQVDRAPQLLAELGVAPDAAADSMRR